MGADLKVRAGAPGDTGQILELMKASLGEGTIPRSSAFWSWKHLQNPFGESPVLVAESDGAIVGLRVFMRWEWEAAGRRIRAVRAVDTATHPQWQGRGIFSRLTRSLMERVREEGVGFIFNTPNARSRPGYIKMGWSDVGRTSLWIRPLRPLQAVRQLLQARRTGVPAGWQGEKALSGEPVSSLLKHTGLDAFLSQRYCEEPRLRTPVTPEYIRWRYKDIPGFAYRAAWNLQGGAGAVVIYRVKQRGPIRELRICDLLVGRGARCQRIAGELMRAVVHDEPAHYATGMAAPGTAERNALARALFVPAPRVGPILTALPLSGAPELSGVVAPAAWRATIGDLEIF